MSHISHDQPAPWWKSAVIYQIYPRSFGDSSGDGVGDLAGITERLDHLTWLGADALWLSPFFRSPMHDFGYDVSDYCDVDPVFGTLADFDALLEAAHARGIRVLIDWVPAHTSIDHPWFVEARASRTSPKRDWYVWRDAGPAGELPNNWTSALTNGAPAWTLDEASGQLYLHSFLPEQPDLNWANQEVQEAMQGVLRFWLDRGVDGFRADVIHNIGKDPALADADPKLAKIPHCALNDEPVTDAYLRDLRRLLDSYPSERAMVGEVFLLDTKQVAPYYGRGDELHLSFNFPPLFAPWEAARWRECVEDTFAVLDPVEAWPTWVLSNHDVKRHRTRYRSEARARAAAMLLLTLRGTPFLYNGEEIGMTDLLLSGLGQFRDTLALLQYDMLVKQGGAPPEQAFEQVRKMTRDRCRTPVHWGNAPQAGFSPADVETWLPVNPNYAAGINVADQLDAPDSLLNFYRRMLWMRKETPALLAGDYEPLHAEAADYFAFLRRTGEQICLVVLNFSAHTHTLAFELEAERAQLIFSSRERAAEMDNLSAVEIAPFEIYIAALQ